MKAAVIGSPIQHSLSPAIFKMISYDEHYPLEYTAEEVRTEKLREFLQGARDENELAGLNVTIPHKEAVIGELDQISEEASMIGAVNVIQRHHGSLIGFNTDVTGIQKTLAAQKFFPEGKTCLVLGAGGSAKAVAYVLGKQKAKTVYIYNPRSKRGQELAQKFSAVFPQTAFQAVNALSEINSQVSLMANATPVGMKRATPDKISPAEFYGDLGKIQFSKDALAFDLIYIPEHTEFLKKAKSLGLTPVGGLGMLVDQAIATWEICVKPVKDHQGLHRKVEGPLRGILRLRENSSPIFLTGFMGVGKSVIGREVSKLTQRTFLDTDQLVEVDAGATVQEIFSEKGEAEFRKLEKLAVEKAAQSKDTIVSLGGGAILDEQNLNRVLAAGKLILLSADEETLVKRLAGKKGTRPLFADLDAAGIKNKIKALLAARSVNYARADFEVSTSFHRNPFETARALISKIGEQNEK